MCMFTRFGVNKVRLCTKSSPSTNQLTEICVDLKSNQAIFNMFYRKNSIFLFENFSKGSIHVNLTRFFFKSTLEIQVEELLMRAGVDSLKVLCVSLRRRRLLSRSVITI